MACSWACNTPSAGVQVTAITSQHRSQNKSTAVGVAAADKGMSYLKSLLTLCLRAALPSQGVAALTADARTACAGQAVLSISHFLLPEHLLFLSQNLLLLVDNSGCCYKSCCCMFNSWAGGAGHCSMTFGNCCMPKAPCIICWAQGCCNSGCLPSYVLVKYATAVCCRARISGTGAWLMSDQA